MKCPKSRVFLFGLLCFLLLLPLGLSACRSTEAAERNAITEVFLDDENQIILKAVLTEGFLSSYSEDEIYVLELPSRYSTDVDLEELDPVAEVKPKASMKAEIPLYEGVRTRLYSSFLLASYDRGTRRYTALTTPMAVSNPEKVATTASEGGHAEASIKGLISEYSADAIRLGVSHTVVDVSMDRLILSEWQEGALSYVWNGVTAYVDAEELEKLDETVGIYAAAGINVYLRFLLEAPVEGSGVPVGIYLASPTSSEAEGYAVNMSSGFSAEIMEGFLDFMADRFATPEGDTPPVTGFIMGYRVNDAATYAYAGEQNLASFVTNYEKLVRVAYTALRSHLADGRVYISLDSHRSAQNMTGGWDVPTFLSAFRDEAALRGDFDWHVACEMYAADDTIWMENAVNDTNYLTVHSLSTLTDIMQSDKYRTPAGEERRLLISGFAIPAAAVGEAVTQESVNRQAASYAFAYMTCVSNGHVEALLYSAYVDEGADSPLCGLWAAQEVDGVLVPSEKRPIYTVMGRVDTTDADTLSGSMATLIGMPYTKLESALAGQARPVTAVSGKTSLDTLKQEHKKAAPLYTFDSGSLNGFVSGGNLTYLELADAETLGTVTLHGRFDRKAICDPMGVTVTMPATNLIGGKELILDLFAGPLTDPAGESGVSAKPTVTLRLTRPAKGTIAAGDGEIVYEATVTDVKGSVWQTATFEIADFAKLLDASDEVTLTILVDSTEGLSHNLGLAGVYVTGSTAASKASIGLVIGIVIALVLLVAGGFVFLFLRHKRKI